MAKLPDGMKGNGFSLEASSRGGKARQAPVYPNGMTERQYKFCQGMLNGLSQSDAYRAAYNCEDWDAKSVHVEASKLRKHPKIALTLSQAVHEAGKLIVVTTESLTHQAREAFELARASKQPGAMIASTALMAKLHGLIIDRSEKRIDDRRVDRTKLVELKAEAMKLAETLGFQLVMPTVTDLEPITIDNEEQPDTQAEGTDEP